MSTNPRYRPTRRRFLAIAAGLAGAAVCRPRSLVRRRHGPPRMRTRPLTGRDVTPGDHLAG